MLEPYLKQQRGWEHKQTREEISTFQPSSNSPLAGILSREDGAEHVGLDVAAGEGAEALALVDVGDVDLHLHVGAPALLVERAKAHGLKRLHPHRAFVERLVERRVKGETGILVDVNWSDNFGIDGITLNGT